MRIVFMGTPDFAVPVLDALAGAGHEIACAYTQPPRPAGRGKKDRPSPVQVRAEALGIEVRAPRSLRDEAAQADFAALDADVAVVVAYGLILPQPVLDAPRLGCINVHASLLPRWRGAAPIHRAIMAGDARTGVCIMAMEAGLDTGPVLMREGTDIAPSDTSGDLHERLAEMGARLAVATLPQIERLSPVIQPEDGVSYAAKIDKSEAALNWSWGADVVRRQINGLSPFPGAYVTRDGARLKLLRAAPARAVAEPGCVADAPGLVIGTGDGAVELLEVQPAGRGPVSGADFRNGARLAPGDPLEG
ncbi:methionyl-tRNA formyltransferase [uncultured Jannaschia sp.]|uniref:methionyl-tRNA formyltransferase n=1 Tax=uncultured Jannaschia sp. TaxID=293347 RepID=UPI002619E920|nr:methionyl-tRNA formyltransferase [uncultured Jannaschia sp.]